MTVQGWGRFPITHTLQMLMRARPASTTSASPPQRPRIASGQSYESKISALTSIELVKQLPTLKRSRTLKLVRRSAIRPPHRRAATVSSDVPEHGKWLVTKGSTHDFVGY